MWSILGRRVRIAACALAALYFCACIFLFAAMKHSPEAFSKVMAPLPMPVLMLFPFETMLKVARSGDLQPGDVAPDFNLLSKEGSGRVRLTSFQGKRPVVLVFGSYT
jgi:hypothetical protein